MWRKNLSDKVLAGVCSGIADEFNIDPIIVRIGWIALTLITCLAVGLIAYVALALIMD